MRSIDKINWIIDFIKVKYPEQYVETYPKNAYLGDGYFVRNGHLLTVNFPGTNEAYVYNTITQFLKVQAPTILNRNNMKINSDDYGNDSFHTSFTRQPMTTRYLVLITMLIATHINVYIKQNSEAKVCLI